MKTEKNTTAASTPTMINADDLKAQRAQIDAALKELREQDKANRAALKAASAKTLNSVRAEQVATPYWMIRPAIARIAARTRTGQTRQDAISETLATFADAINAELDQRASKNASKSETREEVAA